MPNFLASTIFGESISENEHRFYIEPMSVSKFLKDVLKRKIPDYQRPYSWSKKNTQTLLDDIDRNSLEGKSWFIGTVYTSKPAINSQESEILDGQQRFTTIQLILKEFTLFKVLYDDWDWGEVDENVRTKFKDLQTDCEHCIFSNVDGEVIQRFEAETVTNLTLRSYILETRATEDRAELEEILKDISSRLRNVAAESRTAQTIERNIELIRKYLKNKFDSGSDLTQKVKTINEFIDTLLNKLWLIEVPLKNADLSLEIFEAINNRGKPLDLLDRLQFRSLIIFADHKTENKVAWKDLYIGVEDLINNGITKSFADHASFYKTLFLGLSGQELPENDDILEYFSENYLKTQDTLDNFFSTARSVIKMFKEIQDPTRPESFIKLFPETERAKVISLFQVVRRSIEESKNTNQLVVNITSKFSPDQKYAIVQSLWNIVRLVLLKDVLANDKSNIIRGDFNKLIVAANRDSSIYCRLFEHLIAEEDNEETKLFTISKQLKKIDSKYRVVYSGFLNHPNEGILRTNDNKTAKLIQYFISHLTDYKTLGSYSMGQYAKEELEHIFPRAYNDHWNDKIYTKDAVINTIKELQIERNWNLNTALLINDVRNSEDILITPYVTTPHKTPNRLIEWHGNKIVLSINSNRRNSNLSYQNKKDKQYKRTSNLVIPEPNTKFGVDNDDWTFHEIIERSLDIADFITNEIFNRSWDEVD